MRLSRNEFAEDSMASVASNVTTVTEQDRKRQKELRKKPVPLLDEITLGPIEKYTKFNIFPWGFLFHILVLLATTAQVLLVINNLGVYSRSQQHIWYHLFQGNGAESNDVVFNPNRHLFTISSLTEHIQHCVDTYFGLDEKYYRHITKVDPDTEEKVVLPVMFEAFYLRGENREQAARLSTNFTTDDIGIFGQNNETFLDFMNVVTNFRLTYLIEHPIPHENLFIND